MIGCQKSSQTISEYNSGFLSLEKQLKGIKDMTLRQEMVDSFMTALKDSKDYPVFESDTTVVILFESANDSVFLTGDMTHWSGPVPMQHISGTNLFFYRDTFPHDARLEYWMIPSKTAFGMPDPLNPYQVGSGFGPMSEIAMPGYQRHPVFEPFQYGKTGTTEGCREHEITSEILRYPHQVLVCLPPAYDNDTDRHYPVVYFQDGIDYIEFAVTPHVLSYMISAKQIGPVIAVFVTPPNRFKPEMPNRMTEYGLNDDYVAFFCDELVPYIDDHYRTITEPASRLVIGDSFGGLISAYIPFKRPDIFAQGYSQSGYQSYQNDCLIALYEGSDKKPVRLYVEVGTFERDVGAGFLPDGERDFLMANRRFRDVLREKGYEFVYREYNEGHTWGNWRRHLMDGLTWFFPGKGVSENKK